MTIEEHPLHPFLPHNSRILFLGSFPPPREKWSMDFFYPNWINDFWRIMGILFYDEKQHFEQPGEKRFCQESIEAFATDHGLAFYDTASKVCRLKDNASDQFLEIITPTDIQALLKQIPQCHHIVTTGGKATEEVMAQLQPDHQPPMGECVSCHFADREIHWWRMPSTSRAYPLPIHQKAQYYQRLFTDSL